MGKQQADTRPIDINQEAFEALTNKLLVAVRDHLAGVTALRLPKDRARVFEALNALAVATTTIVKGSGDEKAAMGFFLDAMMLSSCQMENAL